MFLRFWYRTSISKILRCPTFTLWYLRPRAMSSSLGVNEDPRKSCSRRPIFDTDAEEAVPFADDVLEIAAAPEFCAVRFGFGDPVVLFFWLRLAAAAAACLTRGLAMGLVVDEAVAVLELLLLLLLLLVSSSSALARYFSPRFGTGPRPPACSLPIFLRLLIVAEV